MRSCGKKAGALAGCMPGAVTKRLLPIPALLVLAGCGAGAPVEPRAEDQVRLETVRVILVGDSTTAPKSGWGDAFCASASPDVTCINKAKGGRSTKSYREEGSWAEVQTILADQGDWSRTYVFVQFGHNDQPGKGSRSSDLATEFIPNLRGYVDDVRAAGAYPVVITPLTRRQFRNGMLDDKLSPWAAAARQAAAQAGAPLLDLASDSTFAVQTLGPVRAMEFAQAPAPQEVIDAAERTGTTIDAPKPNPGEPPRAYFDYTHLGPAGAEFFASMVAGEVRAGIPELALFFPAS